jgi:membrane protein DedA with SNARE-associated domain
VVSHALFLVANVPSWLQDPDWLQAIVEQLRRFIVDHPIAGLSTLIFLEELGVPLPVPGDLAVIYAGSLTTDGTMPFLVAYLSVVAGAMLGSTVNMTLSRLYGKRFVKRVGPYLGITDDRLAGAKKLFQRWGPWAIIAGRHVPGLRIVLSAISGILNVPYRVFIPCVALSAAIWAAILLEVGRLLGPKAREIFGIFPAHLVPWVLMGLGVLLVGYLGYEHGSKSKAWRRHLQG